MKFSDIKAVQLFAPFKDSIGDTYSKVCNDAQSLYGRVDKDIIPEGGRWRIKGVLSKGMFTAKSAFKLALPLNDPLTTLTQAGLDFEDYCLRHSIDTNDCQVPVPKSVASWLAKSASETKASKPAVVEPAVKA